MWFHLHAAAVHPLQGPRHTLCVRMQLVGNVCVCVCVCVFVCVRVYVSVSTSTYSDSAAHPKLGQEKIAHGLSVCVCVRSHPKAPKHQIAFQVQARFVLVKGSG